MYALSCSLECWKTEKKVVLPCVFSSFVNQEPLRNEEAIIDCRRFACPQEPEERSLDIWYISELVPFD
jgi:hypothetical protein